MSGGARCLKKNLESMGFSRGNGTYIRADHIGLSIHPIAIIKSRAYALSHGAISRIPLTSSFL